ncbi:hypothetical protein QBC46DRAFT_275667, partial [Diplogelasinospora grovesii]
MRLNDVAKFLNKEFEVEVTRFSIRRALGKDASWSKKVTQNVAQEQNADLRDDYMHEACEYRSDQLI